MKTEQVWSDEPGVQVRFQKTVDGKIRITRILKAENGHEYMDETNSITIRPWRWDRICRAMNEEQ